MENDPARQLIMQHYRLVQLHGEMVRSFLSGYAAPTASCLTAASFIERSVLEVGGSDDVLVQIS